MPDDLVDRFADLMVGLDHPMAIVTTASGEVRSGCLIGFHCQCGIEPPRYAIWLSKANHTYRVGGLCETFAVHFPAADDHELAELFGTETGDETDKFARISWTRGPDDVPLLDACPTRFVGRRVGPARRRSRPRLHHPRADRGRRDRPEPTATTDCLFSQTPRPAGRPPLHRPAAPDRLTG